MSKLYKVIKDGQAIQTETPGKYAGWRPEKIFGRLDCKSGMRMKSENRVFLIVGKVRLKPGIVHVKVANRLPRISIKSRHAGFYVKIIAYAYNITR
ncbi:MAG: hypothetical protein A3H51_02970 [Candidatus Spechtbacteria bacterium RIFCSPLOWO2_02_FULL_38_8]|uniref:Uncharacterized protein n=1 Tax=Candidatus Spechtbacteria bacterium RIFCSPLOWO2_02_FULL_38_8 TaxID=1802164 RepID=A0A1G2HKW4_9BACT|nr:MAG: hypothetical protein A3H51_02970 [Candidatus Spechtbacteria bacterium RIFCSPLOWO2_02_FULL_38_8]